MNDLNFFYVDTNKESDAGVKKAIFSAAAIVGAGIIVTLSFNTFGIYRAEKSISDLNNKINEEAFVENYKESLEVATERKTFSTYNSKLNEIFHGIIDRNKLSPDFIEEINYTLPKEVYFKSMNFAAGSIEINASATNREAIAEFQHNMNNIEFIEESHIGGIVSDLGDGEKEVFTFTMTCKLKEAYYNESK
ncbi:PilN domain-containing protein [uncultured Clostridium sp.]|uniref:PilN domain-containing protein n=1 Tax=uncultured Clostridium sp. TaxID=59620 RepID=UPI003216FFC1